MMASREERIMQGLLVLCLAAGFACFAFIFLPDHLAKAGIATRVPVTSGPTNISELIPLPRPAAAKKVPLPKGTIARFVPEGRQVDPSDLPPGGRPGGPRYDPYAVAGGAGAAIDEESFEARQPVEAYDAIAPAANENSFLDQEAIDPDSLQARAVQPSGDDADLAIGDPYSNFIEGAYLDREPVPEKVRHQISSLARGDPAAIDSERGQRKKPWLLPPPGFEVDVAFWRDIYAKYDKNYVVLHHPRYLGIVYDVVNLTDIDKDPRLNDVERDYMKKKRVDDHRSNIEDALATLATNPPSSSLTHEQWRIKNLFNGITESDKFKRALKEDGVRAQLGQRDKFIEGLAYSGRYLGEIESIFEAYGLPKELTRLIFVESMFDTNAVSSAGASGIWQFMPGTGKLFLGITRIADERNDPIRSTHAAAKLLSQNYAELGTWPLAINAYNAGRGRLKQAVEQLGTTDIGPILRNFQHRSYGFASRNFYLEFLAAYEVAEHAERYFGRIQHDEPLTYEAVRSNYHISLPEVARLAGITSGELHELNPAFTSQVMNGKKLVPRRTMVRVPEGRGDVFLASAARAPGSRTGAIHHVVSRGETLRSIAIAYGVTPAAIMKSNRHVGRRLVAGQKLVIPTGGDI